MGAHHVASFTACKDDTFSRAMQMAPPYSPQGVRWAAVNDAPGLRQILRRGCFFLVVEPDAHHRGHVVTSLRILGVERPAGPNWRGLVYGR